MRLNKEKVIYDINLKGMLTFQLMLSRFTNKIKKKLSNLNKSFIL